MRPACKYLLGTGAVLSAAVIALLVNTSWIAPVVERRITAVTGRPAQIGHIDLGIGRCLRLSASEVHIARLPSIESAQAWSFGSRPVMAFSTKTSQARVRSEIPSSTLQSIMGR